MARRVPFIVGMTATLRQAASAALALVITLAPSTGRAQTTSGDAASAGSGAPPVESSQARVTCSSPPGGRERCGANTSSGVILARSLGAAPCLLGKTWGYDDTAVWVADGCGGEFVVAAAPPEPDPPPETQKPFAHIPNVGFLLFDGEKGQIYFRLFSYVRYLNQRGIDGTYTDSFGTTKTVQQRQDVQLAKFFSPFAGWFLTPKFRYYLYVWSSNASQGDAAQVVGAGNLSYTVNRFLTIGGGITSLPTVRSTEGQFPYWLGVDGRLIADEFFRGSYTNGVWVKGDLLPRVKYNAMFATNLSILGVSAAQIDNKFDTQSYALTWLPTTGEFGLYGTFGDFDYHEKVATRLGVHVSHSLEEKQSQPGTNAIENSQIRLSDGNVIFTPDLFGPGIAVNEVDYKMMSIDAGIKYRGLSLEGEYYRRWLGKYAGVNVGALPDMLDTGYQLQSSAMVVRNTLQLYLSGSQIFGGHGDASEIRVGENYYFTRERGLRFNTEFIHVNKSPVGYTAYPMPVGASGNIVHVNLEMNF
jgi:Protein of unknown function (DUF3011)